MNKPEVLRRAAPFLAALLEDDENAGDLKPSSPASRAQSVVGERGDSFGDEAA